MLKELDCCLFQFYLELLKVKRYSIYFAEKQTRKKKQKKQKKKTQARKKPTNPVCSVDSLRHFDSRFEYC